MNREETIQIIVDRFREMSTETVMFHQTVADELGLSITHHKCMDIIHRFGAIYHHRHHGAFLQGRGLIMFVGLNLTQITPTMFLLP